MHPRLALPLAVITALAAATVGVACSEDSEVGAQSPDGGADGPSGPSVTVTTRAPSRGDALGASTNATWAAYRLDDGDWRVLASSGAGMYAFPLPAARWSVAVVCSNDNDAKTAVTIHHRTLATRALDVVLEEQCSPAPGTIEHTLTGNITNAPASTQWLDFGYARDSRGVAIPLPVGGASPYELVGVESGTWDLAFAVRDEPFRAPSRIVIRRDDAVTADRRADIDMAGSASFVPSSKRFALHAIGAGDSVQPMILYGCSRAGGPLGIDLGPQDVPADRTDVALEYSTIPEGSQRPADRYRGDVRVQQDRRTDERAITFDFHSAIDLDLTLLPAFPAPTVTVVGATPVVRLATRSATLPNAVRYDIRAVSALNRRTEHAWRTSYDAAAVAPASEIVDTMPDLSALPGFKASWSLPPGNGVTVFVTAFEAPQPLGDGTLQRSTSKGSNVVP